MKESKLINPIEIFTSLDLEMNQPSGKIIQIGAVVGNITTGEILEKLCINVKIDEPVTEYITNLTGITQEDIDNGVTLLEAYEKLKEMHLKHDSFINSLCWGGGDIVELFKQLNIEDPESTYGVFGRRWIDVKTLFVSWRFANRKPIQGGLAKSMGKVGLSFEGRKHNAMDDALNTFRMYMAMLERFKGEYVAPGPTPKEKARLAYQEQQRIQAVNKRICTIGACIHEECNKNK